MIGLIVVLATGLGVFLALYIAGQRRRRQRVLSERPVEEAPPPAETAAQPLALVPMTEVAVSMPPPGAGTA